MSQADGGVGNTRNDPAEAGRSDLVVVANRLPFDLELRPDGSTRARQSPGGLVTALAPILAGRHGSWIGWPGSADAELPQTEADGLNLHPLTLSAADVDAYYEGFSNATLWPLYHDAVAESQFHREWWDAYRAVNQRFAERAAQVADPGATVWVHDYQLQLVPQLLRALRPDVRIGFFLHIPFPPAELFNRLPWRSQILTGLLGADLIGFQLPGGSRNFVRLIRSNLGVPWRAGHLEFEGRSVRVGAFPISIDSAAQSRLAATPAVHDEARVLRAGLGDPGKVILGVDRLDYTKGIDIRLRAFSELLADRDPAVEDAVMVQIATPSRERLNSYRRTRENIERQVGAMNGDHGRIGRPAVHYLHQSLPREELAAFYVAADVMAVTPLRDGMNLVAKEYVACRVDGGGVLLLSEFTGAAKELRSAIQVNPFDTDAVKDGLRNALTMPVPQSRQRMRTLRRQVLTHDVHRWAADFLSALEGAPAEFDLVASRLPTELTEAVTALAHTETLLVATDFDGTLAPIVSDPAAARADPRALHTLLELAELPGVVVAVLSGRARAVLGALLGDTGPLHLIGSHGGETADSAADLEPAERDLLDRLRTRLADIAGGHPGVALEEKPTGIAVHLREAGSADADTVTDAVESDPATWPGIRLLQGKKVLELSVRASDKGSALVDLIKAEHVTGTIFFGDDVTDEHAFEVLAPGDLGIKVGSGRSAARTRVDGPDQVADVLRVVLTLRHRR